ncbi:MAG TPA: hypothetical protein P5566_09845, partial [Spirochaetota bacterium]|nr:hypothetical protein [Spirochaetota bacterium]
NITVRLRSSKHSKDLKVGQEIIVYPIRKFTDLFQLKKRVSTLAEISSVEIKGKIVVLQLKGLKRVKVTKLYGIHLAEYITLAEELSNYDKALTVELRKKAQELIFLINVQESDRLIELMNFIIDVSQISDFLSNYFVLDDETKIELLNKTDISDRSKLLQSKIEQVIEKLGKQV